MTYEAIVKDIKARKFGQFYLFSGEEPYYVDKLTNALIATVQTPEGKEFDETICYGKDTDVTALISSIKRYPLMSAHHLVVLKEAQAMKDIDALEQVLDTLPPTTILVLAFKKKLDGRKAWVKKAKKAAIAFQSDKVSEWKIQAWVASEARAQGLNVDQKGASMLVEFLGTDLNRISSELNKLKTVSRDGSPIDPALIQRIIGVSKDYNMFELQDALVIRNVVKANKIIKYWAANPKVHPIQMTIPGLFSFFSKILLIHANRAKDTGAAMKAIGAQQFYANKILSASRTFSYKRTVRIISMLREYDMRSKGVGGTGSTTDSELLKELIYRIMH